jgi:hypothetical protein
MSCSRQFFFGFFFGIVWVFGYGKEEVYKTWRWGLLGRVLIPMHMQQVNLGLS